MRSLKEAIQIKIMSNPKEEAWGWGDLERKEYLDNLNKEERTHRLRMITVTLTPTPNPTPTLTLTLIRRRINAFGI